MSDRSMHLQAKTTLTEETDWKLRLVLRSVSTTQGRKVDHVVSATVQFREEEGYEPPQGSITTAEGDPLKITKSYWKLSEDPNDRKDGLWIWGLFKEPLYPFMLLQMEVDEIPLSEDDTIQPLQLYAQINHKRDDEAGVILEAGELKVRQMETINADPFGVASVDVYEEVNIGTLSILPTVQVTV